LVALKKEVASFSFAYKKEERFSIDDLLRARKRRRGQLFLASDLSSAAALSRAGRKTVLRVDVMTRFVGMHRILNCRFFFFFFASSDFYWCFVGRRLANYFLDRRRLKREEKEVQSSKDPLMHKCTIK